MRARLLRTLLQKIYVLKGDTAMSPESNVTGAGTASGRIVTVPAPASGADFSIPSSPGGVLQLGFDPGAATVSRVDNSLVFELDGGGKVTVTDFFAVGDESLPGLRLPDGTEVASADFFQGSDLDLSTAAGPAAGSPPGGGTNYADDPGALLDGVDKFGMLGTDYWGRSTEVTDTFVGAREFPGGAFTLDVQTDLGGMFVSAVYEDARPYQHLAGHGADDPMPGRIEFAFTPSGTTVVTGIHLSGFHAGSVIEIGRPGDLDYQKIAITDTNQIVDFTQAQFADPGVFITPPPNSDADMGISALLDLTALGSGLSTSVSGAFTIVVDAVADKPVVPGESDIPDAALTEQALTQSGEAQSVSVRAAGTFGDVEDGSERHYIELRNIPTDWLLTKFPDGWVLLDAGGNPVTDVAAWLDEFNSGLRNGDNGFYTLRFDVTDAARSALDPASGTGGVSGDVEFNPQDYTTTGASPDGTPLHDTGRWTDGSTHTNGPAQIEVAAIAEEQPGDAELDLSNNYSETTYMVPDIVIREDVGEVTSTGQAMMHEKAGRDSEDHDFSVAGIGQSAFDALSGLGLGDPLGLSQTEVSYNFFSDGVDDPNKAADSKFNLSWNADPDAMPVIYAKPTDQIISNTGQSPEVEQGYARLQWEVSEDGRLLTGYFYDNDGNRVTALVGYIEPDFAGGNAKITFAQYQPVQHKAPDYKGGTSSDANTLASGDLPQFPLLLSDEDGDLTPGSIGMDIRDDVAVAGGDLAFAYLEENNGPGRDAISGNLLNKTATGQDGGPFEAGVDKAASGSDGWAGDAAAVPRPGGVVSYQIEISQKPIGVEQPVSYSLAEPDSQDGWTLVGAPKVGRTYTILDANGNPQGEFSIQANGDWILSQAGHDVIRDFDITVTYTVQDADGDQDSAALSIAVQAAPIMVGVTCDKVVFESRQADSAPDGSVNDVAGMAVITLTTYNHDRSVAQGAALYESVNVTLKISSAGSQPEDLSDFNLEALRDANNPDLEFTYDGNGQITVTIPAGYNYDTSGNFTINIPLADDARGGFGTTSDGPEEGFKVELIKVAGVQSGSDNQHYLQPDTDADKYVAASIPTSDTGIIVDDGVTFNETTGQYEYLNNRLDGDNAYDHKADEHPLDGPMFGLKVPDTVSEGKVASIRLEGTNPNTGQPYSTATAGSERYLQERVEITMKFTLADGADAADVTVKYASVTGATYQYYNGSAWVNIPSGGIPAAALSGGSVQIKVILNINFDLSTLKNVGLNVTAVNDNLGKEDGEAFQVAITGATGNESSYFGEAKTTEILDDFTGKLTLAGNSLVWEGGTLEYTFTLTTDSKITGTNTGDVRVIVQFGGTAAFGDDYDLDSIGAANSGLTFTDLSGQDDGKGGTYPEGTVEIVFPPSAWLNDTNAGSHDYVLKVPTKHDDQLAELDETVTITIMDASGAEIKEFGGSGTGTIEDRMAIYLTSESGKDISDAGVIYEDSELGQTFATYLVHFKHDDGAGKGQLNQYEKAEVGDTAASTFTFDLTLQDGRGSSGARFDSNMLDNTDTSGHTMDAKTGDYHWAVNGEIVEYEGIDPARGSLSEPAAWDAAGAPLNAAAYLINAVNTYLADEGFTNIRAVAVSNNGRTLTFEVAEGADLSNPLPIQVGAIDDRLTEGDERYSLVVHNIKPSDTDHTGHNVIIDGNREVGTTIRDDSTTPKDATQYGDGFFIGLRPNEGNESDKQIALDVRAFQRDPDGDIVDADPNNPPSQSITVHLRVGEDSDTAKAGSDYYLNGPVGTNSHDVTLSPEKGNWEFVMASGDVPAHWRYIAEPGAVIPLNDDRLSEGDEHFTVQVDKVSGNESAPLTEQVGDIGNKADMTIRDDYSLPGKGGDALDGPDLAWFGPASPVIEPVARDDSAGTPLNGADGDGIQINADAVVKPVTYKVIMTECVAEPSIVFLNITPNDPADPWADYEPRWGDGTLGTLGRLVALETDADPSQGLYTLDQLKAMYPNLDFGTPDGGNYFDPNGGGYFLIIPQGSAEASFVVNIKHDNDSVNLDSSGVDRAPESIDMNITNIVGSETVFDKDKADPDSHSYDSGYAETHTPIADDGQGPQVSITHDDFAGRGQEVEFKATMNATATEDVTVTVTILDDRGNSSEVLITIKAGQTEGTTSWPTPNDADYLYIQIGSSQGGESRHDNSLGFMDLADPQGSRLELGIAATNIQEEGETTVGYTITGTLAGNAADIPSEDLSFTLKVINNTTSDADFRDSGPGHDVTVTIPWNLLQWCTEGFTLEVYKDDSGALMVTLTDTSGTLIFSGEANALNGVTVQGGDLAQAFDDTLVEGNESFTTIITNISGPHSVDSNRPMATSIIEDNDVPLVRVVYYADETCTQSIEGAIEGHGPVYARVEIGAYDDKGEWTPLALGNGDQAFILETGGGAVYGADYALGKESVTVPGGASCSEPFPVYLPDDYRSEGPKDLIITARPDNNPTTVQNYPGSTFVQAENPPSLTIEDYINGPLVTFSADRSTVGENSEVNYWVTLDKALEEAADLTFKVGFDTDAGGNTAAGFVPDDIESVTVNDTVWTREQILSGDAEPDITVDNGNWLVHMHMSDGSSKDGFMIALNNDRISEAPEHLRVELVGTQGGELLVMNPETGEPGYISGLDSDGNLLITNPETGVETTVEPDQLGNLAKDTTVTDVPDGPVISLAQVDSQGTEGGSISVGINLSKATVSETTITLQLGSGEHNGESYSVATDVVDVSDDRKITVTGRYSNGDSFETTGTLDTTAGTVSITLPEGVEGPLNVTFPLQDNALTGAGEPGVKDNPDFIVTLEANGIQGGEAQLAGGLSYGSRFENETGDSQTFTLTGDGSSNADATAVISLSGIPDNNAGYVKSVIIRLPDGSTTTVDGSEFIQKDGKLTYTMDGKVSGSLANGTVTVIFDTDRLNEAGKLAEAKLSTDVSGSLSGMELTIPVLDDVDSFPDGPVFSVAAHADSGSFTEDSGARFVIRAEEGDMLLADNKTQQDITVSFTLHGPIGDPAEVTVSLDGTPLDVTCAKDLYTVTLPAGTDLPLALEVYAPTVSDTVVGTEGKVTLSITAVSGNEATINENSASLAEVIAEDSTTNARIVFEQTQTTVTEGGSLSFTMNLRNGDGQAMTAAEPLTVTFALSLDGIIDWGSVDPDMVRYEANLSGGWLVTVQLPEGSDSLQIELPLLDVPGFQDDRTLTISGVEVESESGELDGFLNVEPDTLTYTVQDPASFHLKLGESSFDGSDSAHGLEIVGAGEHDITGSAYDDEIHAGSGGGTIDAGAGNDAIYGSNGNDLIIGGSGSDTMSGGAGADTFAWDALTAEYNGDCDKILDFSMQEGDKLRFADLINDPGSLAIQASVDAGNLVLTLTKGEGENAVSQTVEISFQEDGIVMDGTTYSDIQSYLHNAENPDAALHALIQSMMIG